MSEIRIRAEAMSKEARDWIEVALAPGGERSFQEALIDAERQGAIDLAGLERLMVLVYAAIMASEENIGTFGPWYREKAKNLIYWAFDAISTIQAAEEGRNSELH